MRQVVLDTETTGMNAADGDRIIEIGCVELQGRQQTGRTWRRLVNPERDVEEGAYKVHGISRKALEDKPLFQEIAKQFIEFIKDSEVIIHNAPFDVGFLNAELTRLGDEWGKLEDHCKITDTLDMAKALHPGKRNRLDDLCERYHVDNSQRELHGALLDAQLLAEVYLAMTSGQTDLLLGEPATTGRPGRSAQRRRRPAAGSVNLKVIRPSPGETRAHQAMLALIEKASQGGCLWTRSAATNGAGVDGTATDGVAASDAGASGTDNTPTNGADANGTAAENAAASVESAPASGATADGATLDAAAGTAADSAAANGAGVDSAAASGAAADGAPADKADAGGAGANGMATENATADGATVDAAAGTATDSAAANGAGVDSAEASGATADGATVDAAAGTAADKADAGNADANSMAAENATAGGATVDAAAGAATNGAGAAADGTLAGGAEASDVAAGGATADGANGAAPGAPQPE